MGADLYLESQYRPRHDRAARLFDKWARRRDRAQTDAARDRAQRQVERYYDEMHACGYFRDSYNSSSLLWLFGLSWWGDVGALLEESDVSDLLQPAEAKRLLRELREREPVFAQRLQDIEPAEGETHADAVDYFQDKYARFKAFLGEAIERDEPIRCSI